MTKVNIHVEGVSLSEAVRAIGLSQFTTDELLKELQARGLGAAALTANERELAESKVTVLAPAEEKATRPRGRPRKEPVTIDATANTEPEPETVAEETAQAEEGDPWDNEPEAKEEVKTKVTASKYTMDDVRAALDACHKVCGLVTARAKMQEVGGSSKLVDIGPEKFGALIAALNGMVKASNANKAKAA